MIISTESCDIFINRKNREAIIHSTKNFSFCIHNRGQENTTEIMIHRHKSCYRLAFFENFRLALKSSFRLAFFFLKLISTEGYTEKMFFESLRELNLFATPKIVCGDQSHLSVGLKRRHVPSIRLFDRLHPSNLKGFPFKCQG